MDDGSRQRLRELAERHPAGGVISVYLDVDPADRTGQWRIVLERSLREIEKQADDPGLAAAVARIRARFPGSANDLAPAQVGFVDVAEDGAEHWFGFQARLDRSGVVVGPRARLAPLLEILDRGSRTGVVLAALDDTRLCEWSAADGLSELENWTMEYYGDDWRERKSRKQTPASGGTGTAAAGRDQYQQRLDHTRLRFHKEAAELIARACADRGWERIIVFGAGDLGSELGRELAGTGVPVDCVGADLLHAPDEELREHVERELSRLRRDREAELLEAAEESVGSEAGIAAGPDEVIEAVEQGRARHVLLDPNHDFVSLEGAYAAERIIAGALTTGAEITPISGNDGTPGLSDRGGTLALLRY